MTGRTIGASRLFSRSGCCDRDAVAVGARLIRSMVAARTGPGRRGNRDGERKREGRQWEMGSKECCHALEVHVVSCPSCLGHRPRDEHGPNWLVQTGDALPLESLVAWQQERND